MPGWNIADVFEVVAAAVPPSPALIQGDRVLSWRDLDRRAGQVAGDRRDRGNQRLPGRPSRGR
jgi:acyl-CoA synthetase (AMP-forming)/AMP-acid ligase II